MCVISCVLILRVCMCLCAYAHAPVGSPWSALLQPGLGRAGQQLHLSGVGKEYPGSDIWPASALLGWDWTPPGSCSPGGLSSLNHCEIMFVKFCCTHWVHILSQLGALQCDSKACKGVSRHFGVFESRHCCPCRYSLLFSQQTWGLMSGI